MPFTLPASFTSGETMPFALPAGFTSEETMPFNLPAGFTSEESMPLLYLLASRVRKPCRLLYLLVSVVKKPCRLLYLLVSRVQKLCCFLYLLSQEYRNKAIYCTWWFQKYTGTMWITVIGSFCFRPTGTWPPALCCASSSACFMRWLTINVADLDPNPDPDPHVFGPCGSGSGSTSQRYGSGSFYYKAKIVKKTLISTVLWRLFDLLPLKNYVKVPSKSNVEKIFFKLVFWLASWRSMMKIEGSRSASGSISQRHGSADPDPDLHKNVMNPQHCLQYNWCIVNWAKIGYMIQIHPHHTGHLCPVSIKYKIPNCT